MLWSSFALCSVVGTEIFPLRQSQTKDDLEPAACVVDGQLGPGQERPAWLEWSAARLAPVGVLCVQTLGTLWFMRDLGKVHGSILGVAQRSGTFLSW